ncbi:MAG: tetratricopeptide repeat protein [Cyanobacteria bacterium REEB67]|nr:tetratricopeptide repeat protein [Cyanobacteria bacterium REEB67]
MSEAEANFNLEANLALAHEMLAACQYVRAQEYFESVLAQAGNGQISLSKYLDCLFGLATACCESGDFNRAEKASKLALSTVQKQMGPKHHMTGSHLNNLALVRLRQGRFKEAEQLLLEAIEIIEKFFESDHPELLKPLENLGHTYQEQQQTPKAVQSLERAISIRELHFGATDPGIKFWKNVCKEMQAAARKNQQKTKPKEKSEGVQLTLFG